MSEYNFRVEDEWYDPKMDAELIGDMLDNDNFVSLNSVVLWNLCWDGEENLQRELGDAFYDGHATQRVLDFLFWLKHYLEDLSE